MNKRSRPFHRRYLTKTDSASLYWGYVVESRLKLTSNNIKPFIFATVRKTEPEALLRRVSNDKDCRVNWSVDIQAWSEYPIRKAREWKKSESFWEFDNRRMRIGNSGGEDQICPLGLCACRDEFFKGEIKAPLAVWWDGYGILISRSALWGQAGWGDNITTITDHRVKCFDVSAYLKTPSALSWPQEQQDHQKYKTEGAISESVII